MVFYPKKKVFLSPCVFLWNWNAKMASEWTVWNRVGPWSHCACAKRSRKSSACKQFSVVCKLEKMKRCSDVNREQSHKRFKETVYPTDSTDITKEQREAACAASTRSVNIADAVSSEEDLPGGSSSWSSRDDDDDDAPACRTTFQDPSALTGDGNRTDQDGVTDNQPLVSRSDH